MSCSISTCWSVAYLEKNNIVYGCKTTNKLECEAMATLRFLQLCALLEDET